MVTVFALGAFVFGDFITTFGWLPEVVIVAILLAQRSLVEHVQAVSDALRISTGDGRRAVARIVSRDTNDMDASSVARSAIESAAENLSDGVIAPAFWYLIGGLPGLIIYKLVNTADSMVGYHNDRFSAFGWASARLDDLLNWFPARLTAFLIAITHQDLAEWPNIKSDARLHRSPNAGWPEAALARALNIAIAGPRSYDGIIQDLEFIHPTGRQQLTLNDIDDACRTLWRVWAAVVLILVLFSLI